MNDDEDYEEQDQKQEAQQPLSELMFDSLENINDHMQHAETDAVNQADAQINKSTNSQGSSTNSPSVSSMSSTSESAQINNSPPQDPTQNNEILIDLHENRFEDGPEADDEQKVLEREPIFAFTELNSMKSKFERGEDEQPMSSEPKPLRCITPPREGANKAEIENEPMQRPADLANSADRTQEQLPECGIARSRKEMFQQSASDGLNASSSALPRVKSITPPREDKRVLKEKTPERNQNVIRETDRAQEVLPSAGSARQTAAIFTSTSANSLAKSIEKSGIAIEGELAEKGIAKSRLAMFSNMGSEQPKEAQVADFDEIKNIAKERLSMFKTLEQQQNGTRVSPTKDTAKKFKEFTPPPQLEPHQLQQRQYIIIDKETPQNADMLKETVKQDEYIPETGLAKSRMKQYLETATTGANGADQQTDANGEQPEKGSAKSLLAKWKSMETFKDKDSTTPERENSAQSELQNLRKQRAMSRERQTPPPATSTKETNDVMPQSGTAKSLLNKWQNIDKVDGSGEVKRSSRQSSLTPGGEDLATIERGFAKNALANYESTPVESNINTQYNNDEEVIPSPGYAKQLKSKFMTLEKEAAKIETSSSKITYVPKRFTSAQKPAAPAAAAKTNIVSSSSASNNGNSDKCHLCDKTVYAMEKIEADKKLYHKLCFKCSVCNCTLKLGNFSSIKEKLYCTPHYIQLFARNGNYDEGFGLENYKRKWIGRSNANGFNENTNVTA